MRLSVGGWEVGQGQGWEADVYRAVLFKDGGLEDIHPSLSLPQFPWVESELVKMLPARPLPITENTDPVRRDCVPKAGAASPGLPPALALPKC